MENLRKITNFDELDEMMNKDIIIYGAGKVTTVLLDYLRSRDLLDKVFCVAVTSEHNNPKEIRGIPVCQIDELLEYAKTKEILIGTMEDIQQKIAVNLRKYGFIYICGMGNLLYAKLRKMEVSYDTDILRMVMVLEQKQNELFKMLRRIENVALYDRKNTENSGELLFHMYGEELREWYWMNTGRVLNFEHPHSFNEKIQWLKIFDTTTLKTHLADKYKVREYVREKIGEQYLIPMYGVWDDFTQIDFSKLPNQFVLKCNHGCGWNSIVKDKSKINYKKMCKKFNSWLATNYAYRVGFELQYRDIQPRIIAEKYISELDEEIYDYRFYCFDGNPLYIWVDKGSGTNDHQRTIYDINWNQQNYKVNYPNIFPSPTKPDNYEEMVKCAKKLSEGFIFVRVDLYSVAGKIYFGEMTFTPQSGIGEWERDEINLLYGDLIKLPEKSHNV